MDFIFATRNPGKIREAAQLFGNCGLKATGLPESCANIPEPEETGATFMENALLKAEYWAARLKTRGFLAVFADDSGLVIDALNGEPGIYSARYLGANTPYTEKNRIILEKLRDVPDEKRAARFVCAIACVLPDKTLTAEGVVEGAISREPRGESGFGYDPVFLLPERGVTLAELPREEKNEISHRGRAIRAMLREFNERKLSARFA
ncbi:MAG: RdgB/HAM1 family non-canonical purine NTP pyrophosphatase [Clostridiales bacterium]|jgi:XTP/dITP diphosphohydrolase|nr:RdgB/HAM1 family non-canonical purine NTP pyrophosphatase [Clostridiales bacterium]